MITVDLTDKEVEDFIALRKAGFFDSDGEFIIFKEIGSGVIRDIKKPKIKSKDTFVFLYKRKKNLAGA